MAFKMAGSSYKKGGTKTKATLLQTEKQKANLPPKVVEAISALKTTGEQEFPEGELSAGQRGKAIKRHDQAYKRGHTEHSGQPQDDEKKAKTKATQIPMKVPPIKQKKSTTKPGGKFTHPSGVSDAQVAANKKAGMVYYADRGKWMYPEKSGK